MGLCRYGIMIENIKLEVSGFTSMRMWIAIDKHKFAP